MLESESTSSVQSKYKAQRPCQNQSKLSLTNLLSVSNILTQKLLIASINKMTIPNSKVQESISKLSLIETSDRHKNKNINMSETGLLVKQKLIQIEDILMENSFLETLLKEVTKVNQWKIVKSDSLNILSVNLTNISYNQK